MEEVVSHGIGSVFCRPEFRGKGYARRMMVELGGMLDKWQQKEGERAHFTVLYSDIGKVMSKEIDPESKTLTEWYRNSTRRLAGNHFLHAISRSQSVISNT